MNMGMMSFMAGAGTGYLKGKQQAWENERQAKEDAWKEEQRTRQRQEWSEADSLKKDLKDAAQTVSVEEGSNGMVKPAEMDNRDVGLAENASLPNQGLMQGQFKVGAKSYSDKAEAEKAATDANTNDAVNARVASAYRKNGQIEKAMTMENAAMDSKLKKLGLSEAEAKHADNEFNRKLISGLDMDPSDWTKGAAKMLTDTNVGGLSGINVNPVLSKDGKTVDFVAVSPEGKSQVLKSFANTPQGKADFLAAAMKADPATKINYLVERAKADRDEQHFQINKALQQQQIGISAGHLKIAQEDASRKRQAFEAEAKIPEAVKKSYTALQEQAKLMDGIIYKAQAEGNFKDDDQNAQALLAKRAIISSQMNKLLTPYIPNSEGAAGAPKADPLGLDTPKGTPAPNTMTAEQYRKELEARGEKFPSMTKVK